VSIPAVNKTSRGYLQLLLPFARYVRLSICK